MDFLDMVPEVIYMLKFEVSTLGMLTPYPLAAPLSLLAFGQMLIIKVIIHESRAAVCKGDTPDSVRDQMMRHDPQFATFHQAYLNDIANVDLQNAFLEEEKQSQLFRLFAHVSLTRDPRATADMLDELDGIAFAWGLSLDYLL
ncbi:hypothetical protein FPRO04_12442 [Fusarium proliferatum]|nr:hypothetical protein FPRO04_12442 [Fusarium proliferatum]